MVASAVRPGRTPPHVSCGGAFAACAHAPLGSCSWCRRHVVRVSFLLLLTPPADTSVAVTHAPCAVHSRTRPQRRTSDFTMVVHHIIRCCCVFIPSSGGGGGSSGSNPSQATVDSVVKNCPAEITARGESWIVLYVCIICNGRLPTATEIFMRKNIGEWAATIRAAQYAGTLNAGQAAALAKMPMWPQVQHQQPSSEKTKLLS